MANIYQTSVFNGLGTFDMGVPEAGDYYIQGWLTLPIYTSQTEESEVVVTVKINNGATIYTSGPGAKGFEVKAAMNALDIFNVTLTSSADIDQQLNSIKTTITTGEI